MSSTATREGATPEPEQPEDEPTGARDQEPARALPRAPAMEVPTKRKKGPQGDWRVAAPSPRPDPEPPGPDPAPRTMFHLELRGRTALPSPYAEIVGVDRPALVSADTRVAVLFESGLSGSTQVAYQVIDRELTAGRPAAALTRAPAIALAPAAITVSRRVLFAWIDARQKDGSAQLYVGSVEPDRLAAGRERRLSATSGVANAPSMASVPGRGGIVAWHEQETGAATCVTAALVNDLGEPMGGPWRVPSGAFPSVTSGLESALLAWHAPAQHARGLMLELCPLRLDDPRPAGRSVARDDPKPVGRVTRWPHEGDAAFPVLTHAGQDTFAMLWWSMKAPGKDEGSRATPAVMFAKVSALGEPLSAPVRLGDAPAIPGRSALVTVDGGFVACWVGPAPEAGRARLLAAFIKDDLTSAEPLVIDEGLPDNPTLLCSNQDIFVAWRTPGAWAPAIWIARLAKEAT